MLQAEATGDRRSWSVRRVRRNLLGNRTLRCGLRLAGAPLCTATFKDAFEASGKKINPN